MKQFYLFINRNVMGEITGSEFPHQILVMGGHIDSWYKKYFFFYFKGHIKAQRKIFALLCDLCGFRYGTYNHNWN